MEFIIKPTSRCNFKCDFCAASKFHCDHLTKVPDELKKAIRKCKPSNLIFTGGEPTMVLPDFYRDLLEEFPDIVIDITSNLHYMMKNVDMWSDVITNKMFKVTTSFNYNGERKLGNNTPYTEKMFYKDIKDFSSVANYVPNFIAVLGVDEGYEMAKRYCLLAKELNTFCRVNGANPIGRQVKGVPRWKMLKIYMRLIDEGYGDYEINCLERSSGKCPINSSMKCQEQIKAIFFNLGDLYWTNCEENINMGINIHKGVSIISHKPKIKHNMFKDECLACKMYRICNACRINSMFMKEEDCVEMKKISKELEEHGWKM